MQNLGYGQRNSFKGLGTLTFVLLFYISRVLLTLIFSILVCLLKNTGAHKYLKRILGFVSKGVFYNSILRISLEAYFELYLISVMNIYTAEYTINGEVLSLI